MTSSRKSIDTGRKINSSQIEFLTQQDQSERHTSRRRATVFQNIQSLSRGSSLNFLGGSHKDPAKEADTPRGASASLIHHHEATEAMRHLPKLIYGVQKVNIFDGEHPPEQDADLSVSELNSSLRMIIKR